MDVWSCCGCRSNVKAAVGQWKFLPSISFLLLSYHFASQGQCLLMSITSDMPELATRLVFICSPPAGCKVVNLELKKIKLKATVLVKIYNRSWTKTKATIKSQINQRSESNSRHQEADRSRTTDDVRYGVAPQQNIIRDRLKMQLQR